MKMRILPLIFIIIFSLAQPIFAAQPQFEDTKILGADGQPLKDITVKSGDSIKLQARLYWYWHTVFDLNKLEWIPQICQYLDFSVYKLNADGTNRNLVWSDKVMTNFVTYNANPYEFKLTEKGTYKLVVKYNGKLSPCEASSKIHVV
ncbi:MAG: hypothetical protein NKF70_12460 [Methanobacterium sp. ERen5]|nr:MAG: hypothetical protein NKF70_12460 [Methanobacterium sp. ERen5]